MAHILEDRIRETSVTGGTGDIQLAGAVDGTYDTLASVMADGDTTWLYLRQGTARERGKYTYNAGANTISRTSIYRSTNGGSAVNFSAGSAIDILMDLPGPTTIPAEDVHLLRAVIGVLYPPQGRLTLASGVPVMRTTQSAKTTLYYTPDVGNHIPVWNGTKFVPRTFTEISVATTDTAKNPAAIGASKLNDWFVWDDAGTLRLVHSPDWTNSTTRSAGAALLNVGGIRVNNASITNGPAAGYGTWVGTTLSDSSSQLNWIMGGSAANGVAAVLAVFNAYNRRDISTIMTSTSSHAYGSGVRQWANVATMQATLVRGVDEDSVDVSAVTQMTLPAAGGASGYVGFGLNTTSVFSTESARYFNQQSSISVGGSVANAAVLNPDIGAHVISLNEGGDTVNTVTFNPGGAANLCVRTRM